MKIYKNEQRKDFKNVVFEILKDEDKIVCYDEDMLKNLHNKLKETHSLSEYRKIKEQAEVGMCSFKVLRDRHCWLNLIKLENQDFKRYGIPSCLLKLMEGYVKGHYAYYVEGKYIPESDGVEEFYNKNHYKIGDDGYRSIVEKI